MKDASMSLGIYFEIKDAESRSKDCRMLTLRNTQTGS